MKKLLLTLGLLFTLGVVPAAAQTLIPIQTISTAGADCATSTACVVVPDQRLQNAPGVGIYLNVGTSGTFHWEAITDETWFSITDEDGNSSATTDGHYFLVNKGYKQIRVRASVIDGDANVAIRRSPSGSSVAAGALTFEGEVNAFDGVLLDAALGDAITDTANDAIRANIVAGTVTANLSATDNAVLDDIADGITVELGATDNAVLDSMVVLLTSMDADTNRITTASSTLAPGAATATTALQVGGTYTAAGITLTDGQQAGVRLDAEGNLLIASADILSELSSIDSTLSTIETSLSEDAIHADVVKAAGPQLMRESKTVDGSTLPNVVAEGQPVRSAATIWGGDLGVAVSPDGLYAAKIDPCTSEEKTTTPFSLTADTVIISAVASKKNYICSIVFSAGATEIVSITEGTGATCGTSEAALVGSTTDASGMPFTDGGGLSAIGGSSTIIAGKTANVDTCLNVSGTERVAGFVTWVQR
jgi:hypothetical protein